MQYDVEYTDTFGGEANYCWVKRQSITMPELTHYGYDGGTNYVKANKVYKRELIRKAKSAMGISGMRGKLEDYSDSYAFRPYRSCTIMFINPVY